NSPEFKELPSVSSLHFIDEPLNNQKLENIILRRVNKNNDKNKHSADSKYWLTTCSGCNKACDDQGNWFAADDELMNHPQIILTHSICPDCVKKYYPEYYYELCQEA
ncbi:MAG: hypothetical protein OEZ36_01830, partial [Spirochaetota bacterium]|nr:hypothetical protein [Spirochaetota bacterium]